MSLLSDLKEKILILDGSMGALLQDRGLPAGYAPDLWNLEKPEIIEAVHREYAEAGADVVITNTFGASRLRLAEYNAVDKLADINRAAVNIARKGAPRAYVAGDIGPLGAIMAPTGEVSFDEGVEIFREQIKVLCETGVDLIMIETMFDLMEIRAALVAANDVRGQTPVLVSMTFTDGGLTDTGTDPLTFASVAEGLNADIIAVNCSTGPEAMLSVVERLAAATDLPIAVQPNAGLPKNIAGKTVFEMPMEKLCSYAKPFAEAGANMIGGCCGSTPEYIRMAAKELASVKPKKRDVPRRLSFSSRMITTYAGDGEPFVKIGEKINPTGRKKFAESIKAGRLDMILADARKQFEKGATALDVNVGVPMIDEAETMGRAITAVQNVVPLPLVIDSSYVSALETGLKVYPGRALVNSINGEDERLEQITPLIKRYGASVIALVAGDDIPEKAVDRLKIAIKITKYMEDHGVPRDRIIFDCLALVVSAMQEGARQTLDTIRMIKDELGCPTVAGVSNVSFGLPERKIINNAFLSMAIGAGLDAAIVNPYDDEMTASVAAASLFAGRDPGCRTFISQMQPPEEGEESKEAAPLTTLDKIKHAIIEGDKESIEMLTQQALNEGNEAMSLFVDVMSPAIRRLGDLFAQRKKFIPHLVAAADTMKQGVAVLDPILQKEKAGDKGKGTIVFATVKGDIHDIGKNICIIMLENFGFNVIDLGRNVPMEEIVKAAKENEADIIALSALMTTTMTQMKIVIDEAKEISLPSKIMVGGAVVTQSFASEIGADAYCKDVGQVAEISERLVAAVVNGE